MKVYQKMLSNILLISLLLFYFSCNNLQKKKLIKNKKNVITNIETQITELDSLNKFIDRIFLLEELKTINHLTYIVDTLEKNKIFHLKIGENTKDRFITKYNFYINIPKNEIKYLNTLNDSLILIKNSETKLW